MIGEKFYTDISTLNNTELNNFLRFAKSVFFNKRTEITLTISLFKKNKNHFHNLLGNENLLYKTLFKTKNPTIKKELIDHFYYCEKLLEDFIVYYVSKNEKEQKLSILSSFYSERNNQKAALSINSKLLKLIEKNKISYKTYYKLFKVSLDRFYILLNDFSYDTFKHAEQAIDYLDKYYFLEKYNLTQELMTDSIMSSRKYDIRLLDEIKNEIKSNPEISKKLLFKIFSISIELYERNVDKESFFTFQKLIYDNLESFDFYCKRTFLGDVSNYLSILYSKTGDNSLLQEVFKNYKLQLEYETIIVNCEIQDANFSQIIRIALYLKEYDWSKNFIAEYGSFLNNKDLVLLSLAEISYSLKDYDKTIEILNTVDLKTTKLNYELKSIYAKTLYDTKEFDLLENHLNTFEIYLRRQKELSKLVKENNLKFVLYFKRLLKNQFNKKALLVLKDEITIDKAVFNRNWVLDRLGLLL